MKTIKAKNLKNQNLISLYQQMFDNISNGYFKNPYLLQDKENPQLFFNALTGEYCYLTIEELQSFNNNEINEELFNHIFYLTNNLKQKLPDIVNEVHKEIKRMSIEHFKNNLEIVILTTTGCNANCFYCYEGKLINENISVMNFETADKIINFIQTYQKNRTTSINIRWFGGEPLLNKKIISYICNKLFLLKINFTSSMISNGLLFNENVIKEMHDNHWNLNNIQITLDGTEEIHNKIKSFKNTQCNAFQTILNNILLLSQEKIQVAIRLNVSFNNKENLINLINYLDNRQIINNNDYIKIYCATLFGCLGDEEKSICQTKELKEQLLNNFKEIVLYLNKYNYQTLSKDPCIINCKASLSNYLIILPDGSISPCEHYNEILPIMNINNFNLKIFQEYAINKTSLLYKDITKEKCQKCWNYPFCYFTFSCGAKDGFCNDYIVKKMEFLITLNLRHLFRKEIDKK